MRRKVAETLAKLNATAESVYLRQVTKTGGDSLLGVGQTSSVVDTPVSPPPAVDLVPSDLVATSGGLYQLGDYRLVFAATTIDETTLNNSLIRYGDEILDIKKIDPVAFGGMVVAWDVIARVAKPSR